MAKQLVNPVERHVEKVVVAVSALALLGAAAFFLISSPNKTELDGKLVTPATIDRVVSERAEDIRARLRNHRPDSVVPDPLAAEFAAATGARLPTRLPFVAPGAPPVPLIDPPITKVADFSLVKVVPPDKPAVTSGRSSVVLTDTAGSAYVQPVDWVTVSQLFNRKTQSEWQRRAYGAAKGKVHIAPPQIQRRAQRPDASWSDDDWVSVEPAPSGPPLSTPSIEVIPGPQGPTVSKDDLKEVARVLSDLTDPADALQRLRPLFYEVRNGTPWSFPVITSVLDVLMQDDEVLFPDKPPAADPQDRYGLLLPAGTEEPPQTLSPVQQAAAMLRRGKELLTRARQDRSEFDARDAYNAFYEVSNNSAAGAAMQNEAKKLKTEAEHLFKQLEFEKATRGGQPRGTQAAEGDGAAREPLPKQQLWVHDAALGSLQGPATYQYRMRFRIFNLFAGEPGKFDNPENGAKVLVASEWSPPSDPVTFEPWDAFFVTTDDRSRAEAGFEFYRWFFGAWVKSRRQRFGIGDRITTTQRTLVPSVLVPGTSNNVEVEFGSGAIVLDVDFTRNYRERRSGRGGDGVRFATPRAETAVILVDDRGRLIERIIAVDKQDPARKSLDQEVYRGSR